MDRDAAENPRPEISVPSSPTSTFASTSASASIPRQPPLIDQDIPASVINGSTSTLTSSSASTTSYVNTFRGPTTASKRSTPRYDQMEKGGKPNDDVTPKYLHSASAGRAYRHSNKYVLAVGTDTGSGIGTGTGGYYGKRRERKKKVVLFLSGMVVLLTLLFLGVQIRKWNRNISIRMQREVDDEKARLEAGVGGENTDTRDLLTTIQDACHSWIHSIISSSSSSSSSGQQNRTVQSQDRLDSQSRKLIVASAVEAKSISQYIKYTLSYLRLMSILSDVEFVLPSLLASDMTTSASSFAALQDAITAPVSVPGSLLFDLARVMTQARRPLHHFKGACENREESVWVYVQESSKETGEQDSWEQEIEHDHSQHDPSVRNILGLYMAEIYNNFDDNLELVQQGEGNEAMTAAQIKELLERVEHVYISSSALTNPTAVHDELTKIMNQYHHKVTCIILDPNFFLDQQSKLYALVHPQHASGTIASESDILTKWLDPSLEFQNRFLLLAKPDVIEQRIVFIQLKWDLKFCCDARQAEHPAGESKCSAAIVNGDVVCLGRGNLVPLHIFVKTLEQIVSAEAFPQDNSHTETELQTSKHRVYLSIPKWAPTALHGRFRAECAHAGGTLELDMISLMVHRAQTPVNIAELVLMHAASLSKLYISERGAEFSRYVFQQRLEKYGKPSVCFPLEFDLSDDHVLPYNKNASCFSP